MARPCPACAAETPEGARFCPTCGTAMERTCPACGASIPIDARFCPACGTQQDTQQGPQHETQQETQPVEERRIVSILFADLAGFTQRSDQADPEDVRRILVPFHALAKEEIERFGGTLDKFIGDAAMGVFGAPVTHEDDPERAVRAALGIRQRVNDMQMPVRVAVTTGEAVVTFGAGPQVGESVAGDVVNTASRLQNVAPIGGVVVGEVTERATRSVVRYAPMEPVTVKGKAEPVAVWLAESMREAVPEREEDDPPPFVGRDRERILLRDLLARTERERCVHLVTVIGEPGIGKSRLVADLGEHVRSRSGPVAWFRGRCLPYGESITFAALEEIVRAALGLRPADGPEAVADKLDAALAELEPLGPEREWLRDRLAPLMGLAPAEGAAPASRDELFAAWTRFLESRAATATTVLVVEDLHWADDAMLELLDHLAQAAADVPMLVMATSRPELFSRHPSWGGGKTNATTISLSPLDELEMRELLATLLLRAVLPPDTQGPLMSRAGGNPLYALEFVRMLEDQGVEPAAIRVPETVQALIAARLDALAPAERMRLQDASVVGDRFWPGALRSLAPSPGDLDQELRELQRRGLIRRSATSSFEDETEFSFAHALIRDVAYGQLPRGSRSRRHRAVTDWLESAAGDRLAERADLAAFHATRALELARVAGLSEGVSELEERALRFLTMAGERQMMLDFGRAAEFYRQALALAPPDHPQRAELIRLATSLGWRSGTLTSEAAVAAYREGMDVATTAGDRVGAARLMRRLYFQLGLQGDTAEAVNVLNRAVTLLEEDSVAEAGPALAELYACRSEAEMFAGRSQESLRWAERSLEIGSRTQETAIMALHLRGNARCELGDMDGVDDLRDALEIARASGNALDMASSYSYLAEWVGLTEGPDAALALNQETIELCRKRGLPPQVMWATAEGLWLQFDAGRWDRIVDMTRELERWAVEQGDTQIEAVALLYHARVLAHRGRGDEAWALAERFLPMARTIEDLQVLAPALVAAVVAKQSAGRSQEALGLLREFDRATADGPTEYRELLIPEAVRICLAVGDRALAERLVGDRPAHSERVRLAVASSRALLLEDDGCDEDAEAAYGRAAEGWEAYGGVFERAHALAGRARCLRQLGGTTEAEALASHAAAIFEALGILPYDILRAGEGGT